MLVSVCCGLVVIVVIVVVIVVCSLLVVIPNVAADYHCLLSLVLS